MINRKIDYKTLFNDMVCFTSSYIKNNNRLTCQIGISGGIDSTIISVLLYEVKKRLNAEKYPFTTMGYSMPTNTSNNEEYFVSTLVGNAFMDKFETKNIEDISTIIWNEFTIGENMLTNDKIFRKGNLKSRLRTMFLYDKARGNHGFVVGTDNFTEKLLGFSTIGGDALADYMPIQNLWKTEVYGLALYLYNKYIDEQNWAAVNAIASSIELTPQDGLGISASDMDQIGAKNYYDVDDILSSFENYNGTFNEFSQTNEYKELIEKYNEDVVNKVLQRRINNFKLNLPIEFKI